MFQAQKTAKIPSRRQVGTGDLVQGWWAMVKGVNFFFFP